MNIKEMYKDKLKAYSQAHDLVENAKNESRKLTEDELRQYGLHVKDVEEYQKNIDVLKKDEELRAINAEPVIDKGEKTITKEERKIKLDKVVDKYIRGMNPLTKDESQIVSLGNNWNGNGISLREQTVGTTTEGGYTVQATMFNKIVTAQKYFGGMVDKDVVTWWSTSKGEQVNIPTDDDTANVGALIAEAGDLSSGTALTFGTMALNAYKYSSKVVKISRELLQDSEFDIAGYLSKQLATRIWRKLNTDFTAADGSSKPRGVYAGASKGEDATKRAVIQTDMINLKHSVNKEYRNEPGCKWMFNDSTHKVLTTLDVTTANYSQPMWQPSFALDVPSTILGFPYVINDDMEDIHPTYKPVLFGNFKYYYVREVLPMLLVRLNELYAANDYVGFVLLGRWDGDTITAGSPIKYIRNATT